MRLAYLFIASAFLIRAGTPDFTRDIAPIIQSKCAICHYEGGPGLFL